MTVAAYTGDCRHGYIYLRGEYPLAREILEHALDVTRRHGYLGQRILGEDFSFDIEIRSGAGAYICGEETAIFNSIEGFRGEPRAKPPFPVERGLFGKPTIVNNVETLINVLEVLRIGGPEYARIGTEKSTGPRLFCACPASSRPSRRAARSRSESRWKAHCSSADDRRGAGRPRPAGGAARWRGPARVRPAPTSSTCRFRRSRTPCARPGVTLGSGVVVAFDDRPSTFATCCVRIARVHARRVVRSVHPVPRGDQVRQEEALARLRVGQDCRGTVADEPCETVLLDEVGTCMRKDSSICRLGGRPRAKYKIFSAIEQALEDVQGGDGVMY